MNRCLVTTLSVLSLALSLFWVRSYYRLDTISRIMPENGQRLISVAGTVQFGQASQLMYAGGVHFQSSILPSRTTDWLWLYPSIDRSRGVLGFSVVEGSYELGSAWVLYRVTIVPYWAAVAICASYPTIVFLRQLRRFASAR